MEEAEATPANDAPESAPTPTPPDWSDVRGFQVIAAAASEPPAEPGARADELGKELAVRAARFAQSIDESIVLASDGLIRWLGDPVARLVGGDDILKPRAVLLADEALTAESREAVETRLTLWIAAHVRKVLGPLEAMAEPGALAENVRELAQRIVQALGVLDRERVRQQVKSLDQSARSALRKLGVRFGAFYIYIPALLKPGARTLCSQLWSLRRGVEPGSERLLAFAASGRTSFAAEAPLSPDTYRVSGFRLCGDRVVRVDIVERLTDLIRAAIPDHMRPGGRPPSDAYGFVVTPQMTSLTGCAGESFASILRSLGFEAHQVKKADFEAATRKAPTEPLVPVVATAADQDTVAEASAAEADVAGEAPASSEPSETAAEEEGVVEASMASDPSELAVEAETIVEASLDSEASEAVVETEAVAELPTAVEAPETIESPAEIEAAADDTEKTATDEPVAEPTSAEGAEPAPASDAATIDVKEAAAAPAEDEMIEIWRPAPRRRPQPAAVRSPPANAEAAGRPPRHHRDQRRQFGRDRDAPPAAAEGATPAAATANADSAPSAEPQRESRRPEGGRPNRGENRRPHAFKGPRSEEGRGPEGQRGGRDVPPPPPKKEPRPQTVDMDSPFAKLLALKPLLERRDKRG